MRAFLFTAIIILVGNGFFGLGAHGVSFYWDCRGRLRARPTRKGLS